MCIRDSFETVVEGVVVVVGVGVHRAVGVVGALYPCVAAGIQIPAGGAGAALYAAGVFGAELLQNHAPCPIVIVITDVSVSYTHLHGVLVHRPQRPQQQPP